MSAGNQGQDFLGKGDHDAASHGEHTVGALGGVVGFEGQANLQDVEAQQDDAHGPDEGEYKLGQVVNNGKGIVRRECGGGEAETKDDYGENSKDTISPFTGHGVLLQDLFPPCVELLRGKNCQYRAACGGHTAARRRPGRSEYWGGA